MNAYLIAFAILAGIGIYLMIRALPRPPRTADALLDQRPTRASTAGTTSSDVRSLIDLNVLAKATGVLTVSSGGQSCSICFLFGRVFHAACGSIVGEDALRLALQWHGADVSFNPKAQLPVQETISRPIPEILNAA